MQNFKSLSRELITDEACIVFLQQKGIIQKYRICNNGHTMILQCTNNKKIDGVVTNVVMKSAFVQTTF